MIVIERLKLRNIRVKKQRVACNGKTEIQQIVMERLRSRIRVLQLRLPVMERVKLEIKGLK